MAAHGAFGLLHQNENTQIAVRHGFTADSVLHIFHCGRGDAAAAQAIIDGCAPLCAFMERRGYVAKPLVKKHFSALLASETMQRNYVFTVREKTQQNISDQ